MNDRRRIWYVSLIAAFYLLICSANIVYHICRCFEPGEIHSPRELFALAGAVFGGLYFFKPSMGRKGLLALTVLVILAVGETDPGATVFHLCILALLMLPSIARRARPMPKAGLAA